MIEIDLNLTPLGSHLLVRLDKPALSTKSGILIPEVAWKLPVSGTVEAVGPGRALGRGRERTTVWTDVGDVVLFERRHLQEIAGHEHYALLLAEDVLAWVDGAGAVHPENDLVLVEVVLRVGITAGGIYLPERGRKKSRSGTILNYGPGRLILSGEYYGTRKSIWDSFALKPQEVIVGVKAYWAGEEPVIHLSRPRGQALVRAGDIMCLEGDD